MSLAKTAKSFKKWMRIGVVVIGVYYIAILLVIPNVREFFLNLFVDRNPPTPIYGVMEPLKFKPLEFSGPKPSIVLDTKNGRLPAGLPRKMTVYKYKGIQYSYLAGKGAQADADALGFSQEELISDLKGKEYTWRSLLTGGILNINTETKSITLFTDLYGKTAEYRPGTIDEKTAKQYTTEILKNLGRFDDEKFKEDQMKVTLALFSGSTLIDTKVALDAQLARVDLYGKAGEYTIYGPNPYTGLMWLMLRNPIRSAVNSPLNYPHMEINYWELSDDTSASYPIITIQEAWKQIVAGNGILAGQRQKNANPFNTRPPVQMEKVFINNIKLAYYETPEFQKYLQPIYVFEGTFTTTGTSGGDIVYYYPALTAEYTRKGE